MSVKLEMRSLWHLVVDLKRWRSPGHLSQSYWLPVCQNLVKVMFFILLILLILVILCTWIESSTYIRRCLLRCASQQPATVQILSIKLYFQILFPPSSCGQVVLTWGGATKGWVAQPPSPQCRSAPQARPTQVLGLCKSHQSQISLENLMIIFNARFYLKTWWPESQSWTVHCTPSFSSVELTAW